MENKLYEKCFFRYKVGEKYLTAKRLNDYYYILSMKDFELYRVNYLQAECIYLWGVEGMSSVQIEKQLGIVENSEKNILKNLLKALQERGLLGDEKASTDSTTVVYDD